MRVLTEKIRKNYTHHTTTNKPQTIHRFVWWMLASTIQFSHNTPHHPEQTTTTQQQLALTWCEHQDQPINNGLLSQTPNSAPTIYLEKLLPAHGIKEFLLPTLIWLAVCFHSDSNRWHDHIRAINHQHIQPRNFPAICFINKAP